jgi:trehalose utilization protein
MINVTVWNEYRHEKTDQKVQEMYPEGIHGQLKSFLDEEFTVRTATLDVLVWWGHIAHNEVSDEVVNRVHERVLQGMGLIVLHSGHMSKIFIKLMGTTCDLKWREADETCRIWNINPSHPITDGIGEYIELEKEEMYGEHFDIPAPDELIFINWYQGGEVFRGGCTYKRGNGKIFYFQPGHETYPSYYNPKVQRVIKNAVKWATPTDSTYPTYGHHQPLEKLENWEG